MVVDDSLPGWEHTGLRVLSLSPGQSWSTDDPGWELVVLPLAGAATVACTDAAGERHWPSWRAGRRSSPVPPTSPTCRRARS